MSHWVLLSQVGFLTWRYSNCSYVN